MVGSAQKIMSEKNYWFVSETYNNSRMLIICPLCYEWYEIPNTLEELKCYRHCPWCGKQLFIKENENGAN